jgi:hypothetical protein
VGIGADEFLQNHTGKVFGDYHFGKGLCGRILLHNMNRCGHGFGFPSY